MAGLRRQTPMTSLQRWDYMMHEKLVVRLQAYSVEENIRGDGLCKALNWMS